MSKLSQTVKQALLSLLLLLTIATIPTSTLAAEFRVGQTENGTSGIVIDGVSYYFATGVDSEAWRSLTAIQREEAIKACDRVARGGGCDSSFVLQVGDRETIQEYKEWKAYQDAGGMALKLFRYAMGGADGNGNDCITCTFLGNFMLGLASFSSATFLYLQGLFQVFMPIFVLIWIGYRTSKLFVVGGEDGRSFIYSVFSKMTIFFLVWLVLSFGETTEFSDGTTTVSTPAYAWTVAGPTYLEFAFGLSSEIRDNTLSAQSSITNYSFGTNPDAFNCQNTVEYMSQFTYQPSIQRFSGAALDVACATERTHMIGFATGLAIIGSATSQASLWELASLGTAAVKMISGFFMLFVFGLSALWFCFLVLDVVVRGLITAALLPFILGALVFNPTRYIALSALRAAAGAVMTAVGIGIVSTVAFFLLTNTVNVYDSLVPSLQEEYSNIQLETISDRENATGGAIGDFQEFIVRIQQSDAKEPQIPMDLTTPWFYYLALCGLAIFSLGKKIIKMFEGLVGSEGASTMADNALKMGRSAMGLSMGATGLTLGAAAFGTKLLATAGAHKLGAAKGVVDALNPFGTNSGSSIQNAASQATQNLMSGADAQDGG